MSAVSIRRKSALVLAVVALGVSACGDDEEPAAQKSTPEATETETPAATAAAGEGEQLALKASEDGGLSFDQKSLKAKTGTVTVTLQNPGGNQMPHNIVIEGEGVEEAGEVVQPGGSSTATADLKPGVYTFYCEVGQHRQAGMEGKLTVE